MLIPALPVSEMTGMMDHLEVQEQIARSRRHGQHRPQRHKTEHQTSAAITETGMSTMMTRDEPDSELIPLIRQSAPLSSTPSPSPPQSRRRRTNSTLSSNGVTEKDFSETNSAPTTTRTRTSSLTSSKSRGRKRERLQRWFTKSLASGVASISYSNPVGASAAEAQWPQYMAPIFF